MKKWLYIQLNKDINLEDREEKIIDQYIRFVQISDSTGKIFERQIIECESIIALTTKKQTFIDHKIIGGSFMYDLLCNFIQ